MQSNWKCGLLHSWTHSNELAFLAGVALFPVEWESSSMPFSIDLQDHLSFEFRQWFESRLIWELGCPAGQRFVTCHYQSIIEDQVSIRLAGPWNSNRTCHLHFNHPIHLHLFHLCRWLRLLQGCRVEPDPVIKFLFLLPHLHCLNLKSAMVKTSFVFLLFSEICSKFNLK